MDTILTVIKLRRGRYAIILFALLIGAGWVGNYLPFSIVNAHFIFGSIAAMLALQIFGWTRGVLAGALIAAYTWVAWNHPWGVITMTAEVAVVGWLFFRRRVTLITADLLYWLGFGIPVGYVCFYFFAHVPAASALFLVTKQAVNGVANALIARLIYIGCNRLIKTGQITLREILFNVLVLFVLASTLFLVTYNGRKDLNETDRHIRADLTRYSHQANSDLNAWFIDKTATVSLLATLAEKHTPAEMQTRLEQAEVFDSGFLRIWLIDHDGDIVAWSPKSDEHGHSNIGKHVDARPFWSQLQDTSKPILSEGLPARFNRTGTVVILLAPITINDAFSGAVGGALNTDRLQTLLDAYVSNPVIQYTLVDTKGRVILTSRTDQQSMTPFTMGAGSFEPVSGLQRKSLPSFIRAQSSNDPEDNIQMWIPALAPGISTIELWGQAVYVAESAIGPSNEWKLILEHRVTPFQKKLYARYAEIFFLLFVILVASMVLAAWVSRRVVAVIEEFGETTRALPARIADAQPIHWPVSMNLEIHHLIANVREMADTLQEKFLENRRMNEFLERQVAARTKELSASEAFLQNVLENIPAMIFIKDAADLHFVRINRAGEECLGYSRHELLGKGDSDFFPEDQADFFTQKDREVLRLGRLIDIPEEQVTTRHRGQRILHTRKIPIRDSSGAPQYLLGISEDITEQKQSYDTLQEANRKLQESRAATLNILEDLKAENQFRIQKEAELERVMLAIEQAGEIVFITDAAGNIEYLNPAFEAATGYSRAEALGQNPRLLKSGRQDQAFYRDLWETIRAGRIWKGRLVNKRKDGKLYTEEGTISPVLDEIGRIINYVAVKRDITDQLNLNAQFEHAQKMESVGRLAGGVAHDFNNMLGAISGYTEMAMQQVDPAQPLYEDLAEIYKAAQRSTDLTRQLLAFASKQTIAPKVLDLNETIAGMLKMLRRISGEDIELTWNPGDRLARILADPGQIDQILANLCVNARDAIEGVGRISIETANKTFDEDYCTLHTGFVPGTYVMLSVSDNGSGMDKATLNNIFEPFFTTKSAGKGTGLGLATVYGIVKQNKGFVHVYSEPGEGTTFRIYLPQHQTPIDFQPVKAAVRATARGSETILLVEDDPALLRMTTMMLEQLGYTVLAANSPDAAVRLAEEYAGSIHLLVTDVIMPAMNGHKLAEILINRYPDLKRLFMSGYTADVIAHHGVLDEGVHFIQKPFAMRDLGAQVRRALDLQE